NFPKLDRSQEGMRKAIPIIARTPILDSLPMSSTETQGATTDGFHLVIDALKLNDIDTIFALPGIPITDFLRQAQGEGLKVISFRHEQHAGNAAAAAGFITGK